MRPCPRTAQKSRTSAACGPQFLFDENPHRMFASMRKVLVWTNRPLCRKAWKKSTEFKRSGAGKSASEKINCMQLPLCLLRPTGSFTFKPAPLGVPSPSSKKKKVFAPKSPPVAATAAPPSPPQQPVEPAAPAPTIRVRGRRPLSLPPRCYCVSRWPASSSNKKKPAKAAAAAKVRLPRRSLLVCSA